MKENISEILDLLEARVDILEQSIGDVTGLDSDIPSKVLTLSSKLYGICYQGNKYDQTMLALLNKSISTMDEQSSSSLSTLPLQTVLVCADSIKELLFNLNELEEESEQSINMDSISNIQAFPEKSTSLTKLPYLFSYSRLLLMKSLLLSRFYLKSNYAINARFQEMQFQLADMSQKIDDLINTIEF
ncbi:Ldb18p NDAI_0D04990 [Naumovozyma dairenensis CBS 421]|uniref:Uncharacterized protein n=1 Tax=Naumovozyma dairenensis (strain ATCC 10597 / BCRC 20456 / CBS 421 / NBRC 0211 / NRRL Y-12639) TaxID=1071378 RepID=G0WAK1_NAUDC|nr:hypothetical protein NDAI_0D04990 [Naumovozyma dairenensis CBS 421]CCD24812.1 hypothetical protein NDAI_0D04990 [Naumovozyma dairenensis CBS 421]